MATKYLDIEGGNDSNDGSSFANRVKTFTKAATLVSPGDTLRVMAAAAVTDLGTNLTWVDASGVVTPAAAQWVLLDDCESGWTASANITLAYSSSCKTGSASLQVAVGASFTTGKACYKALSGSTDLSAYQQLSFWLRLVTTATWPTNVSIKLCSDTTGDVAVDTITIPSGGYGTTSQFNPMLINKGSAFGNAIQSIAIYIDSDIGAQTFEVDNLVAVKSGTGEISVRHLVGQPNSIGAGGSDTETWYPIRGFSATQILLGTHWANSFASTTVISHRCTAGTLAGKTQLMPNIAVPNTNSVFDFAVFTGTQASKITISGGWDRTAMSSQSHQTWLSWAYYSSSSQQLFSAGWFSHCIIERLHFHDLTNNAPMRIYNSTLGKMCIVTTASAPDFVAESSTVDGLWMCAGAVGTWQLVDTTVAKAEAYLTGTGQRRLTVTGYGSTVTCAPGLLIDNPQNQNILTSSASTYGVGYISTLLRRGVVLGTVGNSATTSTIPTSSLSPAAGVTDQFKGRVIVFDRDTATANLRGQVASITASTSGGTLTVSALTTAPASGDTFMIV